MLPKITWLMEKVRESIIHLAYMHTGKLPPDLGTKSMTGKDFIPKRTATLGME
jgi:hypothetical protein